MMEHANSKNYHTVRYFFFLLSVWAPPSDGCLQYGWNTSLMTGSAWLVIIIIIRNKKSSGATRPRGDCCVYQYANPLHAFTYIYALLKFICVFAYISRVYLSLYGGKKSTPWKKNQNGADTKKRKDPRRGMIRLLLLLSIAVCFYCWNASHHTPWGYDDDESCRTSHKTTG